MKAAVVERAGQPPVYAKFAAPEAEAGELLIEVAAAALSPLVRARASGAHYSSAGRFPFVAGVDGVGRDPAGRRMYFLLPRAPYGAMAEHTVVPTARCLALPDAIDDAMAATIANPGMASWAALAERARIVPGETVLVNGATGAAGRLAVPIARHLGAGKVIATGRDPARLAALGADATILVNGDDVEAAFRDQFAGGVDVVLDFLWGASAHTLLTAAAKASPEGVPLRFVQIGSSSGADIALPAAVLRSSSIVMMGSGLGSVSLDRLLAAIDRVMHAAESAGLALEHRLLPLSRVAEGWAAPGDERVVFVPSP